MKESIKILVIDDHPATRTMISILLSQLGYHAVSLARDGVEGLKKLRLEKYDLVLSDWDMPEMDGLALWKEIRADDALKKIPLILVTAANEVEKVKIAFSEGITNYMVKPITLQALTEKIQKALK